MQVTAAGDTTQRRTVERIIVDTLQVKSAAEIQNLPVRGYVDVARLNAGVVTRFGNLFIRGGRFEETGYYVDGVGQNNYYDFSRADDLISNSLAEVRLQTGSFNAEYGFANSGLIQALTKTGGSDYALSGEMITDGFLSEKEKNLGAFSYGYNLYNFALSGPLPMTDKVKFYLAAERQFLRDQSPTSGRHPELAHQSPQRVEGPLPDNSLGRWNWNGNLVAALPPLQLQLGGHSTRDEGRVYLQEFAMFNAGRMPRLEEQTDSYFLKATHTLGTKTFYIVSASCFRHEFEFGDNVWFDNLEAYGDISRNPQLRAPGLNPAVSDLEARFAKAGAVFNFYQHDKFTVWNLQAALNQKVGSAHHLRAGVDYRYNTIRAYSITPFNIAQNRAANPTLSDEEVYKGSAQNLGYDIFGKNTLAAGLNGAKHPVLAATYLQNRIEVQNAVLSLGLRWDYFDSATPKFRDPLLIVFNEKGLLADRAYLDFRGEYSSGLPTPQDQTGVPQFITAKTHRHLSPRLRLALAVTDHTVLHAQYGKFIQPPEFNLLLTNYGFFATYLQSGFFTVAGNAELAPIKTSAFEIGLRQKLNDFANFNLTAFYKENRDLITLRAIYGTRFVYATYSNEDESTAKGISATVSWRLRQSISTNVAYTLQSVSGTSVGNASNILLLGNPPVFPAIAAALDYDQRHTLTLNADFRAGKDEGPQWLDAHFLGEVGLNLLFTYGSGFPYTPTHLRSAVFATGPNAVGRPTSEISSARTPSTYYLDAKLDKSFSLSGMRWNVYLWAINILGTRNVTNVYDQTGEPDTDGWLESPEGMAFAAQDPTGNAVAFYRARVSDPFNFGVPRQLRLGLRFEVK